MHQMSKAPLGHSWTSRMKAQLQIRLDCGLSIFTLVSSSSFVIQACSSPVEVCQTHVETHRHTERVQAATDKVSPSGTWQVLWSCVARAADWRDTPKGEVPPTQVRPITLANDAIPKRSDEPQVSRSASHRHKGLDRVPARTAAHDCADNSWGCWQREHVVRGPASVQTP